MSKFLYILEHQTSLWAVALFAQEMLSKIINNIYHLQGKGIHDQTYLIFTCWTFWMNKEVQQNFWE